MINIPHGQRLVNIIQAFKVLTGIPQMCGTIDGLHIELTKKPTFKLVLTNYWNQHDHHIVVLQVVCDTNLTFWDVVVLAQGGTHDATHLQTFSLYRGFIHMEILQDLIVTIGDQEVRSYIVVDSTYPTFVQHHESLPTKKRLGDEAKDDFDKALRKWQVNIKNAFAHLKSRW